MDASYKIQRGIHVHLIQFFMCPEFWVHIIVGGEKCRGYIVRILSEHEKVGGFALGNWGFMGEYGAVEI